MQGDEQREPALDRETISRLVAMRDAGSPWKDVGEHFGLTRQQARYAYQIGKRAERRRRRAEP